MRSISRSGVFRPSLRSYLFLSSLAIALFGHCAAQEQKQRRVMTWVPPYAVETCRERLEQSFDGADMKSGLTHVGLQFWLPTEDGGLTRTDRFKKIDDSTITSFQKWGQTHGVRIMLCVYNGKATGWDWDLAKGAFDTYSESFVDTLVAETVRLNLDGVDIDFEGKGNRDTDQDAFVRFIKKLSERLHAEGKELTVDTFAYKWNAPNQFWWPVLLPYVDGLHVMGYAATGADAASWRSYAFQYAAAGDHQSKLLIGMPSFVSEWQQKPAQTHLRWIWEHAEVGLAIWDAQLKDPGWQTKEIWQLVSAIKNGRQLPDHR